MTGLIALSDNEISVQETAGSARVSFTRSGDASGAVNIKFTLTGDGAVAGSDYIGHNGSITIPAGQRTAFIDVPIINDTYFEPTQDFIVAVLSVSSGTLTAPRTTRVNILDDENPVTVDPQPPLVSDYDVEEVPLFNVSRPIDIEWMPDQDNIMFVASRGGQIRVFDTDTNTQLPDFIDLSAEVGNGAGLQSIEIHPNFPEDPYIYAYYSVDPPETAQETGNAGVDGAGNRFMWLVRIEADPETGFRTALPDSKVILAGGAGQSLDDINGGGALNFGEGPAFRDEPSSEQLNLSDEEEALGLEFRQDYIKNEGEHVGGGMTFGPDGMLYLSTGDGVAFNFADPRAFHVQDPNSLSGKVLRLDPLTGRGLADNPFREAGDSLDLNRSKVYQVGLRNPFSLGFSNDGQLVIADTGQSSYEEINIGAPGANFGWPFFEGADFDRLFTPPNFRDTPTSGFADEWAEFRAENPEITRPWRGFAHKDLEPGFQFQAIVGGDVDYDGGIYPDSLNGHYFFSDFSDGEVFVVDLKNRNDVRFLYQHEGEGPLAFTQGPDGRVYVTDIINQYVAVLEITDKEDPVPGDGTIGAVREIRNLTHETQVVSYGAPIEDAVLFASPVSRNGKDPLTLEIDRIGTNSATVRLQEADYLNGTHSKLETATLLALKEGVWAVGDDERTIEVGTVNIGANAAGFTTVMFDADFEDAPLVITQLQSDSGDTEWVVVRTRNITADGFQVRLQEEAANDGRHAASVVGYLAIESSALAGEDVFEWSDLNVQAFATGAIITNRPTAFELADAVGGDALVSASLASFRGATAANLRMNELSGGRVQFAASEELSVDPDPFHKAEDVQGLAFSGSGLLEGIDLLA